MKHLAAILAFTLLATSAVAQDDPDIEVHRPVASTSPVPAGVVSFDADWTAFGTVAMAFVEAHKDGDKLIVATCDVTNPAAPVYTRLGEILVKPWRMTEVSLAVPSKIYGDDLRDRIFVAASVQAPVQGSNPPEVVNSVRLFSTPILTPKLELASVNNLPGMAVLAHVEPPHAQVTVLAGTSAGPGKPDYLVELAFLDPNSQAYGAQPVHGKDHQIMVARSFDYGATLGNAFYVTGDLAQNCKVMQAAIGCSLYGRVTLAADESFGGTVLAFEDVVNDVVHVLSLNPSKTEADFFGSTPDKDSRPEFAPRIASDELRLTLICLGGSKGTTKGNELLHFSGTLDGLEPFGEYAPIHQRAASEGDIEVRGMKAFITARCYPDAGGAALPMAFQENRDDKYRGFPEVPIADRGDSIGVPRAAATSIGMATRASYLFGRGSGSGLPEGVWMDP